MTTAHNSTFAIGGVSCSADSFVVTGSSVLRMNICAEKPAHRKSAKRYASLKKDQTKTIPSLTIVKNANASQNDKYKKPTYEN
jgi:hypothetical protein